MKKFVVRIIFIVAFVYLGWFAKGYFLPSDTHNPMKPNASKTALQSVFVQNVSTQNVQNSQEFIGIVQSIKSANIIPDVSGYIKSVHFSEGAFVNKGDLLFSVNDDKYKANAMLRQGELDHANANLTLLEKEYQRQLKLYKQKYVADAALEKATANLAQAKSLVKQAQANLKLANIDVQNSLIKAPISGVIGKAFVSEGNYVSKGVSSLAKIVQQNPIRVAFAVSDKELLKGKILTKDNIDIKVQLADGSFLDENIISFFIDNEVDTNTASVIIFIEFQNKKNLLVAGNYVRVFLSEKNNVNHIVIPAKAIADDNYGSYVFVLNENNIVNQKRIKIGNAIKDNQIVIDGLDKNDTIVVEGLQKIKDGAAVNPIEVQ